MSVLRNLLPLLKGNSLPEEMFLEYSFLFLEDFGVPLYRKGVAIQVTLIYSLAKQSWLQPQLVVSPFLVCSALSAPKSRDSLRLRRRFSPLPRRIARLFKAPRCAISFAKKIASERRFSLRLKGTNLVPTAECPAIPESAAKIASERRCAILVHSVFQSRKCAINNF